MKTQKWYLTMDPDGGDWGIHILNSPPHKMKLHGKCIYPSGNFAGDLIIGFDETVVKMIEPGQCLEIEPLEIKLKGK